MPEATTPPNEPEKFVEEVESGDRMRGLHALRTLLANRLAEGVPSRDLAALTRRLMQVMEELEALGAYPDEDDAAPTADDELADRQKALLSAAGVDGAAKGGNARAPSC